mmetsp:Transcript_13552/g.27684  ORF Transcript_13552/g.27684 Transcript_13552/m.27684 type:complete len:338 (+) Transcript_13552:154-1167(+)
MKPTRMLEPASDSESDSSSSVDEVPNYSNFDDLPSSDPDDSSSDEDQSDSDSDSGDDDHDESDVEDGGDGPGLREAPIDNDMSLGERMSLQQERGMVKKRKNKREETGKEIMKRKLEEGNYKRCRDNDDGGKKTKKKKSKHAPTIASNSRKAFYARGAPTLNSSGTMEIKGGYKRSVDPRFDSVSGNLDMNHFDNNYKFLEEMEEGEIKRLKERQKSGLIKGKKGQKLRKKLGVNIEDLEEEKKELNRLQMKRGERKKSQLDRAARKSVKKAIRSKVENGGKAYYLKKREMKKLELEAKFEELKKRGGNKAVKKALEKRRKKNKAKDRSSLPTSSTK